MLTSCNGTWKSTQASTLLALLALAVGIGGTLSMPHVCVLFFAGIVALNHLFRWSFSILHDLLHGTCVRVDRSTRDAMLPHGRPRVSGLENEVLAIFSHDLRLSPLSSKACSSRSRFRGSKIGLARRLRGEFAMRLDARGHLSHHKNLGRSSMGQIFDSPRMEFEARKTRPFRGRDSKSGR